MIVRSGCTRQSLITDLEPDVPLAWWQDRCITREVFLRHVGHVAECLPVGGFAINLCQDRYLFMVAFAALIARRRTNLLPPGQAGQLIERIASDYPGSYPLHDADIEAWINILLDPDRTHAPWSLSQVPDDHPAAIVFTSGTTGSPRPHVKRWGHLREATWLAQRRFGLDGSARASLLATVPPQHMYGLETSVLVPMLGGASVHGGRPFFPEDIRRALTAMPSPRVLITTPVHLRACVGAGLRWPALAFVISATAPLSKRLAVQAEALFCAEVLEIYGCSEAGSIASRRTVAGNRWTLYDGIGIEPQTRCVQAPHLVGPVPLQDDIRCLDGRHFRLLGRHEGLINIAGKRISLTELDHRLNAIDGVQDGVFFLPEERSDRGVARLVAFVVAPGLSAEALMAALRHGLDPAFLPRPLYKVEALPRNATGKLPRGELLTLLRRLKDARTRR